jgi:hypothetical protein
MNAVLLFLPMIAFMGEFPAIQLSQDIWDPNYWVLMMLAGAFGGWQGQGSSKGKQG